MTKSEMTHPQGLPIERAPDVVPWTPAVATQGIGRAVICTSADARYARLAIGLVESLRRCDADDRFSLVVADLGVPPREAEEFRRRGARLVKPDAELLGATPAFLAAYKIKSMLPSFVPGFDTYVWLDADTLVLDGKALAGFAGAGAGNRAAVSFEQFGAQGVTVPGLFPNGTFGERRYNEKSVRAGLAIAYADNFGEAFKPLADDWLVSGSAFAIAAKSGAWETIRGWFQKAEKGRSSPLGLQQAMTLAVLSGKVPACQMPESFLWTCTTQLPSYDRSRRMFVDRRSGQPITILHWGELRTLRSFDFPTLAGDEISLPLEIDKLVEHLAFSPL